MLKDADHSCFASVYIVYGYTAPPASGLIHQLPSSNSDFICICLYLTPRSFSVADLPPGSKGSAGKVIVFCSFTNAWNLVISHGRVLPANSGPYLRNSSTGSCRALPSIQSSTTSHPVLSSDTNIFCAKQITFIAIQEALSYYVCR